jgi:hypothetical protein
MNNMTLSQLLSDLRFVAEQPIDHLLGATELDYYGDHLVELGWASVTRNDRLLVTAIGCDILFACDGVVLDEAA